MSRRSRWPRLLLGSALVGSFFSCVLGVQSSTRASESRRPADSAAQDTERTRSTVPTTAVDIARADGPISVLARGQRGPDFVAVDDHYVYWTNFEDDSVMKVDKPGSGSATLVRHSDFGQNKALVAGGGKVVWGGTAVRVLETATGRLREFPAPGSFSYNPVLSGDQLFFAGTGENVTLQALNLATGKQDSLAPPTHRSFKFATDGKTFYVAHMPAESEDSGWIEELKPAFGKSRRFAASRYVWQILVDDTYVYWLEGKRAGGIRRAPRHGDGPVESVTGSKQIEGPQALAMDATHLFWTELGFRGGAVGQVGKFGAEQCMLATNQVLPQGIAVDADSVYWVNYGPTADGSVNRVVKWRGGACARKGTEQDRMKR